MLSSRPSLLLRTLRPTVRRASTVITKNDSDDRNSFTLRTKIDHLLRMQNPTQAEDVLKKSTLEGREYSWNLLIKYHAKSGNYTESERVYQLVFDVRAFLI